MRAGLASIWGGIVVLMTSSETALAPACVMGRAELAVSFPGLVKALFHDLFMTWHGLTSRGYLLLSLYPMTAGNFS